MNAVYDDVIGWYDSDEEYCIESCGNRAVVYKLVGLTDDNVVAVAVCQAHMTTKE